MTAALVLTFAVSQAVWSVSPPAYTLGDTVRLERSIPVAEATVRLQVKALDATSAFQPIRPPLVVYRSGGAVVRYVVAPFEPGEFTIAIPAIDLVYPDGTIESVDGGVAVLAPTSVLPARGDDDSLPEPRWSQPPLPRATSRLEPALMLAWLAMMFVGVWGIIRRRVRPRPRWPDPPTPAEPPVTRWVSAGEPRAVAALVMHRVRAHIADRLPVASEALSVDECMNVLREERPPWPLDRLEDTLRSLERASFAPAVPSDVLVVVDETDELLGALGTEEDTATV